MLVCREKERIAFNYLTSQKYAGEHAVLDVWRNKEEISVTIQLMRPCLLVPLHLANADPSFFVVAGIIFTVCSEPYLLSEYGVDYMSEAPVRLLERLMHGEQAEADEQVQILTGNKFNAVISSLMVAGCIFCVSVALLMSCAKDVAVQQHTLLHSTHSSCVPLAALALE